MIFTNSDLLGLTATSGGDATTPCDVEMVPVLGAYEEAGGFCPEVPEVAAEEEVYPLDDQVEGGTFLVESGTSLIESGTYLVEGGTSLVEGGTFLEAPLTQSTAIPLTIVGVETTEDLVAIDLVAVSTVTTDLRTPSTDTSVGLDFGCLTSLAAVTPSNPSLPTFTAPVSQPYLVTEQFKAPAPLDLPLDLSTPTRERISLALELASPTTTAQLVTAAAGVDSSLAEAAMRAFTTGCMTPIIKEELKCSIQNKRLSEGKEELEVDMYEQRGKEKLSPAEVERRTRRRERNRLAAQRCRQKRQETAETYEEETKDLEKTNKNLHDEISSLEEEKAKLMEMLLWHDKRAHADGLCRHRLSTSSGEEVEEEIVVDE